MPSNASDPHYLRLARLRPPSAMNLSARWSHGPLSRRGEESKSNQPASALPGGGRQCFSDAALAKSPDPRGCGRP